MNQSKEVNYFSKHYDKEWAWYADKFEHCEEETLRGEASVSYLEFAERTAPRVREDLPGVKFLFVLRDPIERAYSDYWFAVQQGLLEHREGLFGDLVRGEVEIPDYWRPQYGTGERFVRRGMYYDSLSVYYDHFEEEHIKVLLTRELSDGAFEDACTFLGIDPHTGTIPESNSGRYPVAMPAYAAYKAAGRVTDLFPDVVTERLEGVKQQLHSWVFQRDEKPPMDPDTRHYLAELYQESNERLETLIEKDISIWT